MDFEMEKSHIVWTSLETESKPGTIEFDVHEPQGLKREVKRNWFFVLVDIGGYVIGQNSSGMTTYLSSQKTPSGTQPVSLRLP